MSVVQSYGAVVRTKDHVHIDISTGPGYIRFEIGNGESGFSALLDEAEAFELDRCLMAARGIVCANRQDLPEPF